ncbi:KilA-N domain-containing protein [Abyssibacter profundi]|mgnify:CR=1 FL=1|uniref:KilA-N domain-containing protein n=1 Tax=Abyssibacter profundi TaxID=2182787 RepID=A0A363UL87_9GAMM|nr:KilA-N domain-containing protein [Abyssibacter profundi]PWN56178.1 hypothetical protein DEH80_07850 [Abyssibacter profundi]
MTQLTIGERTIRARDGRFSLNDLHRASGGAERNTPNRWIRNRETQDLIKEVEQTPDLASAPIATKRGGHGAGTYACKELVYAYAMWISPKFHLHVIRAFDALQQHAPQAAQSAPADHIVKPPDMLSLRVLTSLDHEGKQHSTMLGDDEFICSWDTLPDHLHSSTRVSADQLLAIQNECVRLLAAIARFAERHK